MQYVDTSALLKRYVDEPDSDRSETVLLADPEWVTARHTLIETRRNLARLLPSDVARARALEAFAADWERMSQVELDATTCDSAAAIAVSTGARTLDALHIAAALRVGGAGSTFVTFDAKQGGAARALGLVVVGP